MKLIIEIPEDSYEATCNEYMLPPDVKNVVEAIKNGTPLAEWLSSFNTDSATECFTAIQELKKRRWDLMKNKGEN